MTDIDQYLIKVLKSDLQNKFWSKVEKTKTCWNWKTCISQGYGTFWISGRSRVRAHRWAYENFVRKIPKGLIVDHICRNRACVNPKHLRLVTNRENILAGIGLAAVNARKDKCKNGHRFTKENTYWPPGATPPRRNCFKCKAEHLKSWRIQKALKLEDLE